MDNHQGNPLDLCSEAILELEELKQGSRTDVPAVKALFRLIRTPAPGPNFQGQSSLSMIADLRSYAFFRDSLGSVRCKTNNLTDFRKILEKYIIELEEGVTTGKDDKIDEAKRFCLAFTDNLLNKQMSEVFEQRERTDSRYMGHESLS